MPTNTASNFSSDVVAYIADETLPLARRQLVAYQFGDPLELDKGRGTTYTATRYNRLPLPFAHAVGRRAADRPDDVDLDRHGHRPAVGRQGDDHRRRRDDHQASAVQEGDRAHRPAAARRWSATASTR
jgi:hypothetical protein